mmetsp:Transcript_49977/g.140044  ORF Transcript_49977/g.140044 Transcript_49977/m.140044 type:complete len:1427 (-) Transcript_49977:87-4367(-)
MENAKVLAGDAAVSLKLFRGVLALCGAEVDRTAAAALVLGAVPEAWQASRRARDGGAGFHITFLTKPDLQAIACQLRGDDAPAWLEEVQDEVEAPNPDEPSSIARAAATLVATQPGSLSWIPLGEGHAQEDAAEAAFVVVAWPAGAAARRKLGLAPHDFHISLGFSCHDVHGRGKGVASLVGGAVAAAAVPRLATLARQLVDEHEAISARELAEVALLGASTCGDVVGESSALEALCLAAGLQKAWGLVLDSAERLLDLDAENEIALRSYAFALFMTRRYKAAYPALERAQRRLTAIADYEERQVVGERLRKCLHICRTKLGIPNTSNSTEDDAFEHAFLEVQELKFPSTAHFKNLGAAMKDDKLLDEVRQRLFCGSGNLVCVEEKIDGANLGISLDSHYRPRLQGRSRWVNWETDGQFQGLEQWLQLYSGALCDVLEPNRHVLFGEWCHFKHTVYYTRLPGYFLAFDIYDRRARRFLSRQSFHARLRDACGERKIPTVPHIALRQFARVEDIENLLERQATFGDDKVEGVYMRVDEQAPAPGASECYLVDRCKLVCSEFRQAVDTCSGWRGRGKNKVDMEFALDYVERCYPLADAGIQSGPFSGTAASSEPVALRNATDRPAEPRGNSAHHAGYPAASALSSKLTVGAKAVEGKDNYPSTPHLPFSPGVHADDVQLADCEALLLSEVVVTEKLDGGNCCIKDGQVYARTHAHPATHQSFSAVKQLAMNFAQCVGDVELYGENMAAVHSIEYGNLTSYFYVFAAREAGEWLAWDEVVALAERLDLPVVPVVFRGRFESSRQVQDCFERWARESSAVGAGVCPEGFVIRHVQTMPAGSFSDHIAKYVRANHIQTDKAWKGNWRKAQLGSALPPRGPRALGDPLRDRLSDPRTRHTATLLDGRSVELQRNFSFLLDDVAVSSTPKRRDQILAMANLGVALVVTLTEESPLPQAFFEGSGVRNFFVPVPNYEPPTVDQVDSIMATVEEVVASGKRAMVHCGGGKGRAGTVAACLLLRYGANSIAAGHRGPLRCHMRSDEVMTYIRDARPGSIETTQQERFVREFASLLWQRAAEAPEAPPDWETRSELEAEALVEAELFESSSSVSGGCADGNAASSSSKAAAKSRGGAKARREAKEWDRIKKEVAKRAPKYLVMSGLAGAGKSTFSRALETSGGWVRTNQDDFKRKGYEELLRRTVPLVRQGKTRLVVDRCNLHKVERHETIDMLGHPPTKEVVCVFFDFPSADCKRRAAARENHPTIPKGGGARIIDAQAKSLERPTLAEGFGAVEVIRSFAEAEALLRRYGVDPVLVDQYKAATDPAVNSTAETAPEIADGTLNEFVTEEAITPEDLEVMLPEKFASWLRDALAEELEGADLEGMYASVEVILSGAVGDSEALNSAITDIVNDVLADAAPRCAELLRERWAEAVSE